MKSEELPELIVCRNETHARRVREQVRDHSHIHVIGCQSLSQMLAQTFARITVCEGVDLDQDVSGEGPLSRLLRNRQLNWGDRAFTIVL